MSLRGQGRWAEETSARGGGGQSNNTAVPLNQKVNKFEELTYLFRNIGSYNGKKCCGAGLKCH